MESTKNKRNNMKEMCLICGLNFNSASLGKERGKDNDMNKMYRIFCKYFHVDQEEDGENRDQDFNTSIEKPSEFLNLNINTNTNTSSKMNSSNQMRKRGKTRSNASQQSASQNIDMIEAEAESEIEMNLSFPFCPDCANDSVIKLCGLNQQLILINRNIQNVLTQISSKIIQSQSQNNQVRRHATPTKNTSTSQLDVNSMRNVLTARRRIFSRWNPRVKLQKLDKENENQPTTSISAQNQLQSSETESTPVDEDVDEMPMTTDTNASDTREKDDENDIVILNDRSETEDETEIHVLKEILHKEETIPVSIPQTPSSPQPETPTTPKPLKSILKTSAANFNNQTPPSTSALDSTSTPVISSSFTLPRRIVYCGNGKYIFGGYSFYKCADGFLCGVARCPFLIGNRNRMLSHVIQKHAGKSKFVNQRFIPYTTTTVISQATTPQRKLQNPKPRRTKLSFSHKIAIKIEKLTDSISDSLNDSISSEQEQEDTVPEPAQVPASPPSSSSPSLPTSPVQIPYVKIEKLRDNNCKSNDRNRNKVRLSKAMALLLEFQKRK